MEKINAAIAGAAGYTGGELIRLLLHHPHVNLTEVQSSSQAGKPVASVHNDLGPETSLMFTSQLVGPFDVLFLCMGHGQSKAFLEQNTLSEETVIIDLSQDFRNTPQFGTRQFIYGLPEVHQKAITTSKSIANPGCFATAIQLALAPLAQNGLLSDVFVTGITGATGAGQAPSATSHFPWRANNISAYKTLEHQHLTEINGTLSHLQKNPFQIHFVPWRGDFARGIFVSATLDCGLSPHEINTQFTEFYSDAPFTYISPTMIDMKQVVNTNYAAIYLEKVGNKLVVHAAIDNLLKGASGQAVQNMNLIFNWPQTTGLKLKASAF